MRALLTRAMGGDETKRLLKSLHFSRHDHDGDNFGNYRGVVWDGLRDKYPTKANPEAITGLTLKPGEDPIDYLNRAKSLWRSAWGEKYDRSKASILLWRERCIAGLPEPVQKQLKLTVGLAHLPEEQWLAHISQHTDLHREQKAKDDEEMQQLTKRALKLQVLKATEEVNAKKKAVKQMAVQYPAPANQMGALSDLLIEVHDAVRQAVGDAMTQSFEWNAGEVKDPSTATVYIPNPRGRASSRGGPPRRDSSCYICGKPGHWASQCHSPPNGSRERGYSKGGRGGRGGRGARGQFAPRGGYRPPTQQQTPQLPNQSHLP